MLINTKLLQKKKNNLNFLNPYASRVGQLIIGNTTNKLCEPFSNLKKDNFELVLSFGSEHIAMSNSITVLKFILVIMVMMERWGLILFCQPLFIQRKMVLL